ncbi:hypothetical protein, partial [Candidatus Thiosymbion oneisti]|uniref:hypothetical protein n=1 Tax=Candidatus Thiosymbion oneisti TaxID=589554 RepID=UPI001C406D56
SAGCLTPCGCPNPENHGWTPMDTDMDPFGTRIWPIRVDPCVSVCIRGSSIRLVPHRLGCAHRRSKRGVRRTRLTRPTVLPPL